MPQNDVIALLPLLVMAGGAMFLLLWDLFQKGKLPLPRVYVGCMTCVISWMISWPYLTWGNSGMGRTAFHGFLYLDLYTLLFYTIILNGALITLLLNDEQLKSQRAVSTVEVDVLILLSAVGGMVMTSAANLLVLFLGFELLSVSVYILSGLARGERASAEAALKYFILGAFSSAFLLYGIALIYAATGTIDLPVLQKLELGSNPLLMLGLGLLIFGFAFKVSLVPFHFWTPDVYQGTPTSIAGYMAVVVKAAAFGSFLRVMLVGFGGISSEWTGMLWIIAVMTMTLGNVVALRQRSPKRMLAYSSIAHAGYALIGFIAVGPSAGGGAVIFYLLAYSFMTLAAFGVVLIASKGTEKQYSEDSFETLAGLGWKQPLLGLTMVIAMLSLAGIPPLAGFMGKFFLIRAAVEGGFIGLAIIAAVNSVISLYYYLRVLVVMYFSENEAASTPVTPILTGSKAALFLVTTGTIYFGLFSWRYFAAAQFAVESLL